jgi:hypothetical protein
MCRRDDDECASTVSSPILKKVCALERTVCASVEHTPLDSRVDRTTLFESITVSGAVSNDIYLLSELSPSISRRVGKRIGWIALERFKGSVSLIGSTLEEEEEEDDDEVEEIVFLPRLLLLIVVVVVVGLV